jgi:hypothetical protein
MDVLKPVLIFLSGLVVASIYFVFHLDRWVPHFGGGEKAIALSILPPGGPGEDSCPVTYAVDNRTDHLVLLNLAGSAGPDNSQWNNRPYDNGHRNDPQPVPYGSADIIGLGGDTVPESSEPGVRTSEDAFPDDSNYGGSLAEYGNDGGRYGESGARPDDYAYGEGNSYAQAGTYGSAPGGYPGSSAASQGFYSSDRGNIPPPPAGQPIPLTPGDNSSPYGAPVPPDQGYGNPSDPNWGQAGSPIRPGEIFFASTTPPDNPDGQPQNCDPNGNTVTVQLRNEDVVERR